MFFNVYIQLTSPHDNLTRQIYKWKCVLLGGFDAITEIRTEKERAFLYKRKPRKRRFAKTFYEIRSETKMEVL